MTIFRVKADYADGKWIKNHPRAIVAILATDAKNAAELVCGRPLREKGNASQYCAQVWPLGGVRYAHEIAHFYSA